MERKNTRTDKITPTCRYEHGELYKVTGGGKYDSFGFSIPNMAGMFVGEIYTCKTCGYTEFFDNEPKLTLDAEGVK